MHSYSVYTAISHLNQLTKLYPGTIQRIRGELDGTAEKYGGRKMGEACYSFPASLGEPARRTAEAAAAMNDVLMRNREKLYGTTVLVIPADDDENPGGRDACILRVPDEDGFWLVPDIADEFHEYFEMTRSEGLCRIHVLKQSGPRLEERLPRLLVRPDYLSGVRHVLEAMELEGEKDTLFLLRGIAGSGKRATLNSALKELYPDDSGAPVTILFSEDGEDPMEPLCRALKPVFESTAEYLGDEDETRWWESEGEALMDMARSSRFWRTARDQGPSDLIQAFTLYLKAYAEYRRSLGRPAYLILDGFSPQSDAASRLRPLLTNIQGRSSVRIILIHDSDDFGESMDLPGKCREISFREPDGPDWRRILSAAASDTLPAPGELPGFSSSGGLNLYRLFHAVLAREMGASPEQDAGAFLISTLDESILCTLFLVHAAAGLADRNLISMRFKSDDERSDEYARCEGLISYGLIREDPDGRIRGLVPDAVSLAHPRPEHRREARELGEYLFERFEAGESIDPFRLFRYLEAWGPARAAVNILDRLLDELLTQRRLRDAERLIAFTKLSLIDLDISDSEALQNVIGASRLRCVLLAGDTDEADRQLREGRISLVGGRGGYADRFRLNKALFFYCQGCWDEALTASKEALFMFQKSGDHNGETRSHLELALALLALGKVRDAQEHFSISRRIGLQIDSSWGVLRASSLECAAQFLLGNLPRAARESREHRALARREGRRDIWLLLTQLLIRISWELGRMDDVEAYAEEGRDLAGFYKLNDAARVMTIWKGRGLAARCESDDILRSYAEEDSREALAFLAEQTLLNGYTKRARSLIHRALEQERVSIRLQGEADDWSDGFFPIEGRLAGADGPLDVLGEWISGFDAYLAADSGDEAALRRLDTLLDSGGRRTHRPFSYLYAYWAALSASAHSPETRTRYFSRAFNDIQVRAGRFDDNQTKHAWLSANPWNRRLMDEAQRRKFL